MKSFSSSWTEVVFVVIGVVVLALAFSIGNDVARNVPEWSEVHEQLTSKNWFQQYFAFTAAIEPLENSKYARNWSVESFGEGHKGFFTVTVSGWKKLDDARKCYQKFVVYFRKEGHGVIVSKIAEPFDIKVVYEEGPNQALLPTPTAVTPPAAQEPRQP